MAKLDRLPQVVLEKLIVLEIVHSAASNSKIAAPKRKGNCRQFVVSSRDPDNELIR